MSRGPSPTPARDACPRNFAFEIEVEVTWTRLRQKPMTVCLSPRTGLLALRWPSEKEMPGEIGTFTKAIKLEDFRAECFFALEKARGRR